MENSTKVMWSLDCTGLEQLFAQHVPTGQAAATADRIRAVTAELAEQLRQNIEDVPAKDYMSSRTFLASQDDTAHSRAG